MDLAHAWERLGIGPTDDPDAVRAAYVAELHRVHPDHSPAADANTVTATLTDAYQLVQTVLDRPPPNAAQPVEDPASPVEIVPIAMIDDDTIAIALPPSETYGLLVEAAHHLGEVTHIEPSSGMVMVVVEFVEAPACQLLLTMQGRATGVTEVFCTVESLQTEPAPPTSAVAEVLLDEVIAASRRGWSARR